MREVMRGARPKDKQAKRGVQDPKAKPPACLYIDMFRVGEGLPQTAGQFPTLRQWASIHTSTCAVVSERGSVCPISSQEMLRFLIRRGKKNGLAMPSPWRDASCYFLIPESLPASSGSPFQIPQYLPSHSHIHINLSHTSSTFFSSHPYLSSLFLVSCSPHNPQFSSKKKVKFRFDNMTWPFGLYKSRKKQPS